MTSSKFSLLYKSHGMQFESIQHSDFINGENFFCSWATVRFSSRKQLHWCFLKVKCGLSMCFYDKEIINWNQRTTTGISFPW